MTAAAIGSMNPALLAQCPVFPVPEDAATRPVHITAVGDKGPPVLFVHGGVQGGAGGGPDDFDKQKPLAGRGWRLRLMNRPGFGQSPTRGPDDMEADAVLIADHLGASSHLVGHSFGGAGALLAAARRPEAVRSLTLVEPALQPMLTTDPESLADPHFAASVGIVVDHVMRGATPADYAIGFLSSLAPTPKAATTSSPPT